MQVRPAMNMNCAMSRQRMGMLRSHPPVPTAPSESLPQKCRSGPSHLTTCTVPGRGIDSKVSMHSGILPSAYFRPVSIDAGQRPGLEGERTLGHPACSQGRRGGLGQGGRASRAHGGPPHPAQQQDHARLQVRPRGPLSQGTPNMSTSPPSLQDTV